MGTTAEKLAKLKATKADLKAALAEKGQTVGDKFSEYPTAVRRVQTGIDTADATAVAADIRQGKTAYAKGAKVTGSMATRTLPSPFISVDPFGMITATETLPDAGYYEVGVKATTLKLSSAQDPDFVASNIKKGVTIFGIAGTMMSGEIKVEFANPTGITALKNSIYIPLRSTDGEQINRICGFYAKLIGGEGDFIISYPTGYDLNEMLIAYPDSYGDLYDTQTVPFTLEESSDVDYAAELKLDISGINTRLRDYIYSSNDDFGGSSYFYTYM